MVNSSLDSFLCKHHKHFKAFKDSQEIEFLKQIYNLRFYRNSEYKILREPAPHFLTCQNGLSKKKKIQIRIFHFQQPHPQTSSLVNWDSKGIIYTGCVPTIKVVVRNEGVHKPGLSFGHIKPRSSL